MEVKYIELLEQTQDEYCSLWKALLGKRFSLLNKYSNWSKYPRKVKKLMKKYNIWNIRYMPFVNIEKLEIKLRNLGSETRRIIWK